MTPAPWIITKHRNQTLITDIHWDWVAVLTTEIEDQARTQMEPEPIWSMDMGDLRLIIASPKLLAAVKESTTHLTRLKTRYPQEVGLEIYIEHNQRLIEAIEEGT